MDERLKQELLKLAKEFSTTSGTRGKKHFFLSGKDFKTGVMGLGETKLLAALDLFTKLNKLNKA